MTRGWLVSGNMFSYISNQPNSGSDWLRKLNTKIGLHFHPTQPTLPLTPHMLMPTLLKTF